MKQFCRLFKLIHGAPYHGSSVVREFKQENIERLTVERLPAFSPDFNPIENYGKTQNVIRLRGCELIPKCHFKRLFFNNL